MLADEREELETLVMERDAALSVVRYEIDVLRARVAELEAALERLADIEDKSFADNCYCICCGAHPAHGQLFGGHADNCALVAARLAIAKARGTP